jgi:hypothetical protein
MSWLAVIDFFLIGVPIDLDIERHKLSEKRGSHFLCKPARCEVNPRLNARRHPSTPADAPKSRALHLQ